MLNDNRSSLLPGLHRNNSNYNFPPESEYEIRAEEDARDHLIQFVDRSVRVVVAVMALFTALAIVGIFRHYF